MHEIQSKSGPLSLVLPYEINIDFARHQRHLLADITPGLRRQLFGEAWATFWDGFVQSVGDPLRRDHLNRWRQSGDNYTARKAAAEYSDQEFGKAYILRPGSSSVISELGHLDSPGISDVLQSHSAPARPSVRFIDAISSSPMKVRGEPLAEGLGYACNQEGKKQLGIVFKAKLLDFYAEEGSLRAAGAVALVFFGTNLLAPLVVEMIGPWATERINERRSIRIIERRLSNQEVECNVTAGFQFSRTELIMKFEHKLNVGGRSGICEMQSALAALGFSPGRIDGVLGSDTKAAAINFANAWRLPAQDVGKPVFNYSLARALTGEQPPYK